MNASESMKTELRKREALRLTTYDDQNPNKVLKPGDKVKGKLTIGYGHTGKDVTIGKTIDKAEAERLFEIDVKTHADGAASGIKVPVTQNQFDAIVSLTYNIGIGAFLGSTVLRKLNRKDIAGAADAFLLWNKDDGKVVAGLVKRRAAERELFLKA